MKFIFLQHQERRSQFLSWLIITLLVKEFRIADYLEKDGVHSLESGG